MPFTSVTHAQLLEELKARWERQPFWTDSEATLYLNHALRTWNLLTGTWQKKVEVKTPLPAAPWISIPGSITYGTNVQFGGHPALLLSSIPELDRLRPQWRGETTASGGTVPSRPRRWAPFGLKELAVWPADASGGASLLIDGVASTPVLSAPSDLVDLGRQELHAITGLALVIGQFKRGISAFQASQSCLGDFLEAAARANDRLRHSVYFRKALGLDKGRSGRAFVFPPAPTPPAPQATQAGR